MILVAIILGTLCAGIGSVWLAAALSFGVLAKSTQHMLSLAAGALLATAFMHLLPEAFASGVHAEDLFMALLVGLVFFFLLDKAELWHHGHEHHQGIAPVPTFAAPAHDHGHGHAHEHDHSDLCDQSDPTGHSHASGSWAVLAGDSVHCFGDGILIASAFIADLRLGVIAALAVLMHEVPHHVGDLVVLRSGTSNRRAALVKVTLAGGITVLGGLAGYWLVEQLRAWLPYFLVVASSSFIYVALADLIPQLQKRLSARQTAAQVAWLAVGILAVAVVSRLAHSH